ncbi:MAG: hypothetical protein O9353_06235 [Bacteroidia bacterium]|nr:hypothetical protein [Bacteroidia bacterium]
MTRHPVSQFAFAAECAAAAMQADDDGARLFACALKPVCGDANLAVLRGDLKRLRLHRLHRAGQAPRQQASPAS